MAHLHVKPAFPSHFQFTDQNKGTFTYSKRVDFDLPFLYAGIYAIRKTPPILHMRLLTI